MDPMTIGALLGGASSLFGSMFGGGNASVDTRPMQQSAADYLNYTKDNYGNANSSYYQTAKRGQYNSLFDMMTMGNRQRYNEMLAQGINPSQKLMKEWSEASSGKAQEGANNFATGLYTQGMSQVGDAYKNYSNTMSQIAQIQSGVNQGNQQNRSQIGGGIAGLGANLLGSYYQNLLPTKMPNYNFSFGSSNSSAAGASSGGNGIWV